jgi:O-methyltransferase involved in polyketide biosynthesis
MTTTQLKVSSTSRLVLEAAMRLYTSPLEQRYISAIDFSETNELYQEIKHYYPCADDMICVRKQFIRHSLSERLKNGPAIQVVILGAGLDPLSLYLLENHSQNIRYIIEVDNGYLEEKAALYRQILPGQQHLHLVSCDVTDTPLLWSRLLANGYEPSQPAILILEGLVYYIPNEAFVRTIQLFSTTGKHTQVMLDIALAASEIPAHHLPGYNAVMNIMEACLQMPLKSMTRAELQHFIRQAGATEVTHVAPCEIEKMLTGRYQAFQMPGEGILEVVHFRL